LSTTTIPQIRTSGTPGSAILEDFRIDNLISQVGLRWGSEHRKEVAPEAHIGYAAELHCKRALRALRSSKEMPIKVTPVQSNDGLKNEDLPELNRRILEVLHQHILIIAKDLGVCAVMFSDPDEVARSIRI